MKKYFQLIIAIPLLFIFTSLAHAQNGIGFNPAFSSNEPIISADGTEIALIYDSPKALTAIYTNPAQYHLSDPNIAITSIRSTLNLNESGSGAILLNLSSSISSKSDLNLTIEAGVIVNLSGASIQTDIPLRPLPAKIAFLRGIDSTMDGIHVDDIVNYISTHPNDPTINNTASELLGFMDPIILDKSELITAISTVQSTLQNVPNTSDAHLTSAITSLRNTVNAAQTVQNAANTRFYDLYEALSNLSNAAALYQYESAITSQASRALRSPLSIAPLGTSTISDNYLNALEKSTMYSNGNFPQFVVELPKNTGTLNDYKKGDNINIKFGAPFNSVKYVLTASDITNLDNHASNGNSVLFTVDVRAFLASAPDSNFTPSAYVEDGANSNNLSPEASAVQSVVIDTTAPTLFMYISGNINYGNSFDTRNSEIGNIYVVPNGTAANLESIVAAASTSGKVVNTAVANSLQTISTISLSLGNYTVYAADLAGNLSYPSSVINVIAAGVTTTDNSINIVAIISEIRVTDGITASTLLNKLASSEPNSAPLSITTSSQTAVSGGSLVTDGMLLHIGSISTYTIKTRSIVATYTELMAALNSSTSSLIKITSDITVPNNGILNLTRDVTLEADNPVTLTALRFSNITSRSNKVDLKAVVQTEFELYRAIYSGSATIIEVTQPIGSFAGILHPAAPNGYQIYLNPTNTMAFVIDMITLKSAVALNYITDVYIASNIYSQDTLDFPKAITLRTDASYPKNINANLFTNKGNVTLGNVYLTKMNLYAMSVEGSNSLTYIGWSNSWLVTPGNKYVYRNFGTGSIPANITVNNTDWTDFRDGYNMPAQNNDKIVIAEVNASDLTIVDIAATTANVSPYGLFAANYATGDDAFIATNLPYHATVKVYNSLDDANPIAVGIQNSASVLDDVYFAIPGGYLANQYGVYASITLESEPEGKRIQVYVDAKTVQTIMNDLFMYNISYSDTHFALPWVPKGYKIEIATSNNLAAIDLAGNINHLTNNTPVNLTFAIKSILGIELGTTQSFTVVVPGHPS